MTKEANYQKYEALYREIQEAVRGKVTFCNYYKIDQMFEELKGLKWRNFEKTIVLYNEFREKFFPIWGHKEIEKQLKETA